MRQLSVFPASKLWNFRLRLLRCSNGAESPRWLLALKRYSVSRTSRRWEVYQMRALAQLLDISEKCNTLCRLKFKLTRAYDSRTPVWTSKSGFWDGLLLMILHSRCLRNFSRFKYFYNGKTKAPIRNLWPISSLIIYVCILDGSKSFRKLPLNIFTTRIKCSTNSSWAFLCFSIFETKLILLFRFFVEFNRCFSI